MKWVTMETVNLKLLVPSGLTVAAAVGGAVGYAVASKVLSKKYKEIADAEIQEAKVYYQGLYSRPPLIAEPETPTEFVIAPGSSLSVEAFDDLPEETKSRMISTAVEALKSYQPPPEERIAPTIVNVFNTTPPGEEVLEALLADRNPEEPYLITKAEFFENEPDHEQGQFTFYEGDTVLVDDKDEYNPILDTEKVVGDDNLLRFGYGSGDEHTLYVRNETLDPPMDLCIVRSTGRYTDEVMGFDNDGPTLKHSQQRKFRLHDE